MDKLIKASDAVDIVAKHSALYGDGEINTDDGETLLYDIMSEIMNLPSAQPDPKWIPFGQSAENDEDRATDDQIADSGKMIKLKKRTITERLIIANSLIAGAIADSDNNQFCDSTKMTDSEDVWEDGYCNYADRKNKDVPDTNVGDMISKQVAIDAVWNGMCTFYDCDVIRNLKALPSAQPQPKTGEWNFVGNQIFECTNCGVAYTEYQFEKMRVRYNDPKFPKFCPNCGSHNGGDSDDQT